MCNRKIEECRVCTRKCPQEKLARDIAEGRMYATNEMIRLQKELQEYKDLEEQGLLLRLPCPIGTVVYNTHWWDDVEEKVKVDGKTYYRKVHKHKVTKGRFCYTDIDEFGKTVFLTKAEAEEALKKMREG